MVILKRIESLITEAKQVGKLYHVCSLEDVAEYIAPKNELSSSGNYINWVKNRSDVVSFTRDKSFVVVTEKLMESNILIQIEIDGDKLSEKYKVFPYNDFAFDEKGRSMKETPDIIPSREKEECVIGPIKNISNYITGINICVGFYSILHIPKLVGLLKKAESFFNNNKSSIKMYPKENRDMLVPATSDANKPIEYSTYSSFVSSFNAMGKIADNKRVTNSLLEEAFRDFSDTKCVFILDYFSTLVKNSTVLSALVKYSINSISVSVIINYELVKRMIKGWYDFDPIIPRSKLENLFLKECDLPSYYKNCDIQDLFNSLTELNRETTFNSKVVSFLQKTIDVFLKKYPELYKKLDLKPEEVSKLDVEQILLTVLEMVTLSTSMEKEVRSYLVDQRFFDLLNKTMRKVILKGEFEYVYENGDTPELFFPKEEKTPKEELLSFLKKLGVSDKSIREFYITVELNITIK